MVSKNNRSVRKTKKSIQAAMLSLMEHKHYQQITVQEIIDRADICRTTFYAHYKDIYDLMDAIEDDVLSEFSDTLKTLIGREYIEGEHPVFTSIAELMKRYGKRIVLLTGQNGDINFQRKLTEIAKQITKEIWVVKYGKKFDEEKYLLCSSFVVTGSLSMISTVLENNISWSPERIGYMLGEIVVSGERLFFN